MTQETSTSESWSSGETTQQHFRPPRWPSLDGLKFSTILWLTLVRPEAIDLASGAGPTSWLNPPLVDPWESVNHSYIWHVSHPTFRQAQINMWNMVPHRMIESNPKKSALELEWPIINHPMELLWNYHRMIESTGCALELQAKYQWRPSKIFDDQA